MRTHGDAFCVSSRPVEDSETIREKGSAAAQWAHQRKNKEREKKRIRSKQPPQLVDLAPSAHHPVPTPIFFLHSVFLTLSPFTSPFTSTSITPLVQPISIPHPILDLARIPSCIQDTHTPTHPPPALLPV